MSQINESAIKTPGVYINEIPSFPPSIAQVATAIPVFVGYTQMAIMNGKNVINQAVRISSLVEYVTYFGMGPNLTAQVTLNSAIDTTVADVNIVTINTIPGSPPTPKVIDPPFQLFNSIQMFFNEGGSACYILSVGLYPTTGANIQDFISPTGTSCFDVIKKEDEPTLIVIPDAIMFSSTPNDFYNLMTSALNLCGALQDRFTIIDVLNGDEDRTYDNSDVITLLRNGIGSANLNYGAVYYPWLNTSLPITFTYQNIQFFYSGNSTPQLLTSIIPGNAYVVQIANTASDDLTIVDPFMNALLYRSMPPVNNITDLSACIGQIVANVKPFVNLGGFKDTTPASQNGLSTQGIFKNYTQSTPVTSPITPPTLLETYLSQLSQIVSSYPTGGSFTALTGAWTSDLTTLLSGYSNLPSPGTNPYSATPPLTTDAAAVAAVFPTLTRVFTGILSLINNFANDVSNLLTALETQITATSSVYANIKNAIANKGLLVPPSGAMAGIYTSVDSTRGVWKAPANVSLSFVISPSVNIDDAMQEDLNVDTNAGKSVNAIRAFTGKGTLVWGARTLTGNDNNFRYISVRRFYIMVETSTKSAAFQFVFEPNDIHTWLKVKAMIENYLFELWQQGALAGIKPESAYYVKVGIGQTMTSQDILEGRMIVEIGMAVVRPAEFIILRFTQMQQTS